MNNWGNLQENDFDTFDFEELNEAQDEIGYIAVSRALIDRFDDEPEDFVTYLD